jgi:hypothetical protein
MKPGRTKAIYRAANAISKGKAQRAVAETRRYSIILRW